MSEEHSRTTRYARQGTFGDPDRLEVGVVTAVLHPRQGGPATSLKERLEASTGQIAYRVVGVARAEDQEEIKNRLPGVALCRPGFPCSWFYSQELIPLLRAETSTCGVYHAHMLWDYPVLAAYWVAASRRKGLLISPHGSLMTEWRRRGFKKTVYKWTALRAILNGRTTIHALNRAEYDACRAFGIMNDIVIIPNGLTRARYEAIGDASACYARWPEWRERRLLVFMGRVWHEKGLDVLLQAWRLLLADPRHAEWLLVIAGPDYREYTAVVEAEVQELALTDHVVLAGAVGGALKDSLLAAAECFVLPSRSEGMSMALLEAMASGLPAVYSPECNFPELAQCGGGLEVPVNCDALHRALHDVCSMSKAALRAMGAKGRLLGMRRYTLERAIGEFVSLYTAMYR